jgi:hypothetical protein
LETEKQFRNINQTKIWFFEKVNEIDELSARLTKKKRRHKLSVSGIKEGISL